MKFAAILVSLVLLSPSTVYAQDASLVINRPVRQINDSGDNIIASQIFQIYLQFGEIEIDSATLVVDEQNRIQIQEVLALLYSISLHSSEGNISAESNNKLNDRILAASEALLSGNLTSALRVFEEVIENSSELLSLPNGHDILEDAILGKSSVHEIEGDIESAISILNEGLEQIPNSHALLSNLARVHAFDGDLDRARSYLRQSVQWAARDGDTSPAILRWHGDAFQDLFDFTASINAYKNAESVHISKNTTNTEDYAFLVQNLASVLQRSGQFGEARHYYELAYVLQYRLDVSEIDRIYMHSNLALFYLKLGCFDASLQHSQHVLGSNSLKDDPIIHAFARRTAARAEMMLGRLESAIELHDEAESQLRSILRDGHWRHAQFLIASAEMNRVHGNLELAFVDVSEAISRLERNDRKPWLIYLQALIELRLIEFSSGNPPTAGKISDLLRKASVLQEHEAAQIIWKLDLMKYFLWALVQDGSKPPVPKSIQDTGYSISYVLKGYVPRSREIISAVGQEAMENSRTGFDRKCENVILP